MRRLPDDSAAESPAMQRVSRVNDVLVDSRDWGARVTPVEQLFSCSVAAPREQDRANHPQHGAARRRQRAAAGGGCLLHLPRCARKRRAASVHSLQSKSRHTLAAQQEQAEAMCVDSASGCEESGLPTGRARFSQSCQAAAGSACQSRARVRRDSYCSLVHASLMGLRTPDLIKRIGVMCVLRIALLLSPGTRPKYPCL